MKHFVIYRKLILIIGTATAVVSVGVFFFMEDILFRTLFISFAFVFFGGLLFLLDFLHNRYNDNLLEEINLNGTADVKATFTAEGRKKNCIIKLEEIEKISSVHREKNEDNAHFIKNPHIFTYLHRLQLQRRTNNQSLILGNPNF